MKIEIEVYARRGPVSGVRIEAVVGEAMFEEWRGRRSGRCSTRTDSRTRVLGADAVETCVLAVDEDGLRCAGVRGFVEVERCVLPGERDEWVDLRLSVTGFWRRVVVGFPPHNDSCNLAGTRCALRHVQVE
ncbi:hypothetical protein ACFXAE_16345 [Streptomyces sp. NPDC059454]|uniref:hypothetical protein n=1 Tax=Streptomyces sp. NPDC059454 TaxID=3346836 RepID=UPI0036ADBE99